MASKSKPNKNVPTEWDSSMILEDNYIQSSLTNSHLIVLTIDAQGIITSCNEGAIAGFKKTPDQIEGMLIFDIMEFDIDENEGLFNESNLKDSFEAKLIKPFWPKLNIKFDTILHKENEEYIGLTLVGENVTKVESLKRALAKSESQLNELFDNSNDLITIFNNKGQIIFTNLAWKLRLGYGDSDLSTLKLKDIIHEDSLQETGKKIKSLKQGDIIEKIETVLVSNQSKKINVTGSIRCIQKAENHAEYRAIFFDITDRIRAERAQSLYYKIANLTIRSANLEMLYFKVYNLLTEVLGVKNMTVTLKKEDGTLDFVYYQNELISSQHIASQNVVITLLSNYTFERRKPLIIYDDGIIKIASQKGKPLEGIVPKIWMGVPIESDGKDVGVISIHSNEERQTFNFKDLELLDFIASQISLAIERKWNEAKINAQGARIRAIFESSSHQMWSIDRQLRFTSFNQNCADAYKSYYDVDISLGYSFDRLIKNNPNPKSQIDWIDKFKLALEGNEVNFQSSIINKNGTKIWRDVFLSPIYLPDGSIEEISAIANDITEKKRAEFALQESEEKFRNIFESFQDIYFQCDIKGNLTLVSPSARLLLGFEEGEYLGKHITKFFNSDKNIELLHRLYKNKELRNYDVIAYTKSGAEVKMLCNIRLIFKNKKPIGIEGVARDITKLKQTNDQLRAAKELAEKSLKVKERFLANMSHEIRTPMNGIIGMIDLIGSTKLNKEQLEYIKTIKKSSETLLNILNDILDLSKIEAGKMELKKAPVNLTRTIEKLYALYSQEAHRNNTSLYYNLDESIPEWNMVDETRLLQILSNLTSNAIKFSDGKGNINISMRLLRKYNGVNEYKVQVKDAGIGISKENTKKLFETFSQIDNSYTKNYSGTGLGLAISKELVKSMNGRIGVVSTPGLGSTFWFTFEAEQPIVSDFTKLQNIEEAPIKRQFVGAKPKILLVDDNAINRTVASQILKKSGCEVITADSGIQAIELINIKKFDLIFMDIQMPNIDGIETTKRIKKLELESFPPIVAMTAYSLEEDRSKFLKQGLDDYLAKPIKSHELIQKVKDWIGFEAKIGKPVELIEASNDLIINQNTLNQLFKYGGEEIIKSVLEDFEKETSQLLKQAKAKVMQKNMEEVRAIMHTLKGNASTLGIEKFWRSVEKLERKLKIKNYQNIKKDLTEINNLFAEYKSNYKSIVLV